MTITGNDLDLGIASTYTYRAALTVARAGSARIADATSDPRDLPEDATYWLTDDDRSGFGITATGDLIAVFSTVKGRGDYLVQAAIARAAITLDCFDGFLPSFYARHGFRETSRESNWTAGGPDVVYMALPFH